MLKKLLIISTLAMMPVLSAPAQAQTGDRVYDCYVGCIANRSNYDWCSAECTRLYDSGTSGGGEPGYIYLPVPGNPCRNFQDCNNVRPN